MRSLVVRTTAPGVVEVDLPPYDVVCAKHTMCLFGIEVRPAAILPRFDGGSLAWVGLHDSRNGRFRSTRTSAIYSMYRHRFATMKAS